MRVRLQTGVLVAEGDPQLVPPPVAGLLGPDVGEAAAHGGVGEAVGGPCAALSSQQHLHERLGGRPRPRVARAQLADAHHTVG